MDISEHHRQIVQTILRQNIPDRTVWAFGSRVKNQAKPYSDLDLAILGQQALSLAQIADLNHDFSESDLPFKVDLVDWHLIDDDFRQIIQQQYVIFQTA